jgi:uncharacterized membrane protein
MRTFLTALPGILISIACGPQTDTAPPVTPATVGETPTALTWVFGMSTTGGVRSEFSARLAGGVPVSIDDTMDFGGAGWGRAAYRFERGRVLELRSEIVRRDSGEEGDPLQRERLELRFAEDGTVLQGERTVDGARDDLTDNLVSDALARAHAMGAAALAAAASSTAGDVRLVLGRLTWGHEVRELEICGETASRWLHDPAGVVQSALPERMPFEPLSVVLRGRDTPLPAAGFAANAEAAFEVVELVSVRRIGRREDCFARELLALGVEPFWSLEVRSDGSVLLKNLGADQLRWLSVAARSKDDHGRLVLELANPAATPAGTLVVTGETCTDPMAGESFPLTASLRLDHGTLDGCAEPGLLAAPARPMLDP